MKMKRLMTALGWMIVWEVVWAIILFVATLLIITKTWLSENFLDPIYLDQPNIVDSYTNAMVSWFFYATVVIFSIGIAASFVWHVSSWICRIYGPGEAARLHWIWLLVLIIGLLVSLGGIYFYVDLATLVPNGVFEVYGAAIVLFILTYYIGTLHPTPPKLRPAVPLARLLPTV